MQQQRCQDNVNKIHNNNTHNNNVNNLFTLIEISQRQRHSPASAFIRLLPFMKGKTEHVACEENNCGLKISVVMIY